MAPDEKIIDKLRKLKAMADSAKDVGNEAEAQAFGSMVQTLLARHRLDASEIEWEREQREELVTIVANRTDRRRKKQEWETMIAIHVARSCSCVPFEYRGSALTGFRGLKLDVEAAREAYLYLVKAAEHLAEREYVAFFHQMKRLGKVERARGYKGSWLTGFVLRLGLRYRENERAIQSQLAGTALIRLTSALARVQKEVKDSGVKNTAHEVKPPSNYLGYRHGQASANKVKLQNDLDASSRQLQ